MTESNNFEEFRCDECNKLLFKGSLDNGIVEIKCRNCKKINTFEYAKGKRAE